MLIDELKQIASKRHMTEAEIDQMLADIESKNQIADLEASGFTRLVARKTVRSGTGWALETSRLPANQIYTRQEIFVLCKRYRLRFLSTERYVGSIPDNLGAAIAQFQDTVKTTRSSGYYICAPKEAFVQSKPIDPILFYRVAEDRFILVHKWGTDISWWRKVLVWPLRSDLSNFATCGIAGTALFAALCAIYGSGQNAIFVNMIVASLLMVAMGLGFSCVGSSSDRWDRTYDLRVDE